MADQKDPRFRFFSKKAKSMMTVESRSDAPSVPGPTSPRSRNMGSLSECPKEELEKELEVELMVMDGAEKMVSSYRAQGDRKNQAMAEAKLMESKAKCQRLKMEMQLRETPATGPFGGDWTDHEQRYAFIGRRLEVERYVAEGAERMAKHAPDKHALQLQAKAAADRTKLLEKALSGLGRGQRRSSAESALSSGTSSSGPSTSAAAAKDAVLLTGRLSVTVNLAHTPQPGERCAIILKVDGHDSATIKPKSTLQGRPRETSFPLERARELQIELVSFTNGESRLVAIAAVKLAPLAQGGRGKPHSCMLELEPRGVGSLVLTAQFDTEAPEEDKRGIRRRNAITMHRAHCVKGHRLVSTSFYAITRCAICSNGLLSAGKSGLQCEKCNLTCHKACMTNILGQCTANVPDENDEASANLSLSQSGTSPSKKPNRLGHSIPHKFVTHAGLGRFCCQCGSLVFGIGRKCEECGIACHRRCEHNVPHHCGMTQELAYSLAFYERASHSQEGRASLGNSEASVASPSRDAIPEDVNEAKEELGVERVPSVPPVVGSIPASDTDRPPSTPLKPMHASASAASLAKLAYIAQNPAAAETMSIVSDSSATPGWEHKVSLDDFVIVSVLGRGHFGKVVLAESKGTKQLFAIKALKKGYYLERDEVESVATERQIFQIVDRNPFLVNLYCTFQSEDYAFFVMEYAAGGDLMMYVRMRIFPEDIARFYAAEVLLAIEYLHKNNIIYRDLKLDNILMTREGHIKLADFGLCKVNSAPDDRTWTFCGTPEFMAPELLLELGHTRSVDWWALGVLLFQMMVGESPYPGERPEEVLAGIMRGPVSFPLKMSWDAQNIIMKLLNQDPLKRLGAAKDAEEIKAHAFFKKTQWERMERREIPPPIVPQLSSRLDVRYFEDDFTSETPQFSLLSEVVNDPDDMFDGFSFNAPWLTAL